MYKRIKISLAFLGFLVFLISGTSKTDAAERTAKGTYIQAGMMGMMDVRLGDNQRVFDLGPGAYLGGGHNWGMFGVRAGFHYANMDGRSDGPNFSFLEANLYGGTFDLKFLPLGEKDSIFQPYLVVGLGPQYIEYNAFGREFGDWGMVGNTGVGFDLFLTEQIALTLETNLRPSLFVQTQPGDNFTYDQFFYSFMGGFTFFFDAPPEATPVAAVAAAPQPTPTPAPKFRAGQKIDLNGEIKFKTASDEIFADSYPELDRAVSIMKAHPEILLLEIAGHTDSRGSEVYNQNLSEKRANSVRRYFISKGIAADRLTTSGYGESQPIAPNDTPENLAKNRRMEFTVAKFKE